jgi:predicted metal-dependent phosphoesterase TrpH
MSTTGLRLAAEATIDLHLHTTHSDGRWRPEALLDHLRGEQFGLAAVADHDRVDTVVGIQQLAVEKDLPVLVAVEMTTTWQGALTDLLCYGFDPEDNALDDLAQDLLRRQQESTREVLRNPAARGLCPSRRRLAGPPGHTQLATAVRAGRSA